MNKYLVSKSTEGVLRLHPSYASNSAAGGKGRPVQQRIDDLRKVVSVDKVEATKAALLEATDKNVILQRLRELSDMHIVLEVLEDSMVGKAVARFCKHSEPDVSSLASAIVQRWRSEARVAMDVRNRRMKKGLLEERIRRPEDRLELGPGAARKRLAASDPITDVHSSDGDGDDAGEEEDEHGGGAKGHSGREDRVPDALAVGRALTRGHGSAGVGPTPAFHSAAGVDMSQDIEEIETAMGLGAGGGRKRARQEGAEGAAACGSGSILPSAVARPPLPSLLPTHMHDPLEPTPPDHTGTHATGGGEGGMRASNFFHAMAAMPQGTLAKVCAPPAREAQPAVPKARGSGPPVMLYNPPPPPPPPPPPSRPHVPQAQGKGARGMPILQGRPAFGLQSKMDRGRGR